MLVLVVKKCKRKVGGDWIVGFFFLWFVFVASGATMEVVLAIAVMKVFVVVVYCYFNELFILF